MLVRSLAGLAVLFAPQAHSASAAQFVPVPACAEAQTVQECIDKVKKKRAEQKFGETADTDSRSDLPIWFDIEGMQTLLVANTRSHDLELYATPEGEAWEAGEAPAILARFELGAEVTGLDVFDHDGDHTDDLLIVAGDLLWIVYGSETIEGEYAVLP
jgi:hypothetical protein